MSLVHNEQTKLTATLLNTAGAASITLGVIAPLVAVIFAYSGPPTPLRNLLIGVPVWLSTGVYMSLRGASSEG